MIWGVEGRHLWYPPMPEGYPPDLTAAQRIAGPPLTLYDYIKLLGPSLYWPLDLTFGATDQSGNGRNGTLAGGPTLGGGATLTGRTADKSTDLDGTDDKITSAYSPFVNGTVRTFVMMIRRDVSGAQTVWGGSGANGPAFGFTAGNVASFDFASGSGAAAGVGTATYAANQNYMLALLIDEPGNLCYVFRDGAFLAAFGNADPYAATPGNFMIGGALGTGGQFNSRMSHVAVYERGLSAVEIANLQAFRLATAAYTAPATYTLNRRIDDAGADVWPRAFVNKITGLQSAGDAADARDLRVGGEGEIPRRSYRRGKTITYEGLVQALSRASLRQAEADLRAAFNGEHKEGLMVVRPHPLYDGSGAYRSFPARALTVDIDDQINFSPTRPSRGHESAFVVAVRNARTGGVSYTDQAGVTYP